jgi:hypothetical protein
MNGIEVWRVRSDLAKRALEDHLAGRYHASIPLVLILMDGFVNDIEPTGFFAENTDLTAWDSIAGHNTSLTALTNLFRKKRKKTTAKEITVPYRNGIIHGRDLGYANKMVSTKVWNALYVVADWAAKVQAGAKLKPSIKPEEKTSLFDSLRKYDEVQKMKKALSEWRPREIIIGKDVLSYGTAKDYQEGTPERALVEFLEVWKQKNYGEMAKRLKDISGDTVSKRAGYVRSDYEMTHVQDFEIKGVMDIAAAVSEITIVIEYERDGIIDSKEISARMICEDANGDPAIRGDSCVEWKVIGACFHEINLDV